MSHIQRNSARSMVTEATSIPAEVSMMSPKPRGIRPQLTAVR
ncbi:hypothetical protein [Streptomyces griseorubiginosus]|nr:hypothetical protein [Streptomyces griseorubiginosus]